MKQYRRIFFLVLSVMSILGMLGCEKKPTDTIVPMHWDRDMCERCKMSISERKFAVEIIDPQNAKYYKFDDLGCAILWMDEEKIPWREKAIIWITDAKTGKWINARKALYVDGAITPMGYGYGAYEQNTLPKGAKAVNFDTVAQRIKDKERENSKKVKGY